MSYEGDLCVYGIGGRGRRAAGTGTTRLWRVWRCAMAVATMDRKLAGEATLRDGQCGPDAGARGTARPANSQLVAIHAGREGILLKGTSYETFWKW
jgi:hypothetical protein